MQIGETWILFQSNPKSSFSKSCRKTKTTSTLYPSFFHPLSIHPYPGMVRHDKVWWNMTHYCWQNTILTIWDAGKQTVKILRRSSGSKSSSQQLSTTLNNSQHLSTRFLMSWFLRIQSKKCNNRKQTFHVCEGSLVVGSVTVLKALNLLSMKLQIKCLRIQLGKELANKRSFFVQVHW